MRCRCWRAWRLNTDTRRERRRSGRRGRVCSSFCQGSDREEGVGIVSGDGGDVCGAAAGEAGAGGSSLREEEEEEKGGICI